MTGGVAASGAHGPRGTVLSPVHKAAVVTVEGLRIVGRVIYRGRVRRDSQRVAAEYDGGYWADLMTRKPWEQSATLSAFLVPEDPATRVAMIDGRLARIANRDYYRYRFEKLQQVLTDTAGDASFLIEIGCGYGANLFGLLPLDRWRPLLGLDVSLTALDAGRRIARHFGREGDVQFAQLDLTDASSPGYAALRGATVFSYYCFEQLKPVTGQVIDNLIGAGVGRVIHLEAAPELWSLWKPVEAVSRLYTWAQDYQDNLLTTVQDRQAKGLLKIREVRRLHYAPSVRHDPTLICWEPSI